MAIFETADGGIHVGYQYHGKPAAFPDRAICLRADSLTSLLCSYPLDKHIQWGNISMGAARSSDFTTFTDYDPVKTLYPSEIYDIRGVFDGTVFKGVDGLPTILYTSTSFGPLGATVNERPGTETQSIGQSTFFASAALRAQSLLTFSCVAYTPDDGASWIKLPYGAQGNPVISAWPEGYDNLSSHHIPPSDRVIYRLTSFVL